MDLTDSDIKILVDDLPKTPIQIDSNQIKLLQLGKSPISERYLSYFGKSYLPIDSMSKSIILFYPLKQNQIINTKIQYEYNPKRTNSVIPIDAFHFLFMFYPQPFSMSNKSNDILQIKVPDNYIITKTNYNNKIIESYENKIIYKGINAFSNSLEPLKVEFIRIGTSTLDIFYYINFGLTLIGIFVVISSFFVLDNSILNYFYFSGVASLFSISAIFLGHFSLELFFKMIIYTRTLWPPLILIVFKFLQKTSIKLEFKWY